MEFGVIWPVNWLNLIYSFQVGSSSFRVVFLPDNAHVILVGSSEVAFPDVYIPPHASARAWVQDELWNQLKCVTLSFHCSDVLSQVRIDSMLVREYNIADQLHLRNPPEN